MDWCWKPKQFTYIVALVVLEWYLLCRGLQYKKKSKVFMFCLITCSCIVLRQQRGPWVRSCTVMGFLQWMMLFVVLYCRPYCCVNLTWQWEGGKCCQVVLMWLRTCLFFDSASHLPSKQSWWCEWVYKPQLFQNEDGKLNLSLPSSAVNEQLFDSTGEFRVKQSASSFPSAAGESIAGRNVVFGKWEH